jgi:glyoxylate reductase
LRPAEAAGARTILAEQALPTAAFASLEDLEVVGGPFRPYLVEPRPDVGGLVVVNERVDAELLELLPALRVVTRFGIGYDQVDVNACTRRGVQVGITPGPTEAATAELAFLLMLAVRRRLLAADGATRRGEWSPSAEHLPEADGLSGATLGLVGFGRIAREVATRASAFGMTIVYTARRQARSEDERLFQAHYVPLDQLLSSSDVVSLHCPLTPETHNLLGARELRLMRRGATLVNTARGGIVDESALVDAVTSGRISAGLDVFADEPTVPSALRRSPNVVLTPHVGSGTRQARTEMALMCIDNLRTALAGGRLANLVPEQQ